MPQINLRKNLSEIMKLIFVHLWHIQMPQIKNLLEIMKLLFVYSATYGSAEEDF
jgi:hypothetical protein